MLTMQIFFYAIAFLFLCRCSVRSDKQADCGMKWQEEYTEFHKNALSSLSTSKTHKYVVSIAPPQGLSDRLSGFVTHFLFALLTKRVYLHVTPPNLPLLGDAYDAGYGDIDTNLFNYTPIVSFDSELFDLPISGYKGKSDKNVISHDYGIFLNAGTEMNSRQRIKIRKRNKRLFTGSDFNHLPYSNRIRIIILGNRGFSYQLFENPYHNDTLYDMGLTPDNAFKCVFNYLFKLRMSKEVCNDKSMECKTSNVFNLLSKVTELQSYGNIVIGIHVRLGDHVFDKNEELTMAMHVYWYMKCALELRQEFESKQNMSMIGNAGNKTTKRAYILFLSDSVDLRIEVLNKYGEGIILTDVENIPMHSSSGTHKTMALQMAAADLHLFSMADYHVISERSGFGQKASFLNEKSKRDHIFYPPGNANATLKCSFLRPTHPSVVAKTWSGV